MDLHAPSFFVGLILGGLLPFVDLASACVLHRLCSRELRKTQVEPILNDTIQT